MSLMFAWRAAQAEFLECQPSTVALTLVYNQHRISPERIRSDLRSLHRAVDRRLYGPRFNYRDPTDRSHLWAVIELVDAYPHVHCGWQLPPGGDVVLDSLLTRGLWRRFAPGGGFHAVPYKAGWATYAVKALTLTDHVIESADFLPAAGGV